MPTHHLGHLLSALLEAIDDPYESIVQTLAHTPHDAFADPSISGTPAFHLHHTLLVFRHHARKAIAAVDPDPRAAILTRIMPDDAPIPADGPWSPAAVHEELSRCARDFCDWLAAQPTERTAAATIEHDRTFTLPEFLNMMTRHIVWHAAAAYYRARFIA